MRNEIEKDLNAYFLKRFGRSTEDGIPVVELYEIVAKPNSVDMDSPEVQNLVAIIMQTIMSSHIQRYTDLSKLWNPLNFCVSIVVKMVILKNFKIFGIGEQLE